MVLDSKNLEDIVLNNRHPESPSIEGLRFASVALLLGQDSRDSILSILKAESNKYPWGNQVALPGGHIDMEDISPMHTALREVNEELGIKKVSIIGSLGHFMTIRNVCVEVYAGFYDEAEKITPLESEISKVMKIPLDELIKTHIEKDFTGRDPGLEELLYPYEDVVVWGMTARIIHHFIELTLDTTCKNPETAVIY